MTDTLWPFVAYLTLFRLAVIGAGVVSIVLGYRLFLKGVWPKAEGGQGTGVDASLGSSRITLKNAAPGTCFALFGAAIITAMLVSGSPEVAVDRMNKLAARNNLPGMPEESEDRYAMVMRGEETDSIVRATRRGIHYETRKDMAKAMAAYQEAVDIMARPINYLAYGYCQTGALEKALHLARMAVQLSPDDANCLDTLAEILYRQGAREEAIETMEKAASLDPRLAHKLKRYQNEQAVSPEARMK